MARMSAWNALSAISANQPDPLCIVGQLALPLEKHRRDERPCRYFARAVFQEHAVLDSIVDDALILPATCPAHGSAQRARVYTGRVARPARTCAKRQFNVIDDLLRYPVHPIVDLVRRVAQNFIQFALI